MAEIDLHTHSTASDGTLTPTELVKHAHSLGLRALAVTDHDTTRGLDEAIQAGRRYGVEIIPGCELSVTFQPGFMHIVGLWISPDAPYLNAVFKDLHEKRATRNTRIIAKLNDLGMDITYQEVLDLAGDATVGRPHIARVLLGKNLVASINEAFTTYLGATGKAYVPKDKLSPERAIQVLKQEQATIILAHPYSLDLTGEAEAATIERLAQWGIDGLEAYYSLHSPRQTRHYLDLCERLHLLPSTASDFHGTVKPDIALGTGKGNLHGPYALLQAFKDHRLRQGLPLR
ncbi:MAG: phosphatase [Deltaproteobacteria bacterium]|nr:MAG: phosphatase [Deltaproteobacteria bacterium]